MAETPVEFGAPKAEALDDGRLDASSFHRNSDPVKAVVDKHVSATASHVLEVASGTGQHVCNWALLRPECTFWPTDLAPFHIDSINGWRSFFNLTNIRPAHKLDITTEDWCDAAGHPYPPLDAVIGMNILHIAPWAVSEGLFSGAGKALKSGGVLMIYGPFKKAGQHISDSNVQFDQNLRQTDPDWGVRDQDDLDRLAVGAGLTPEAPEPMPANNFTLIYRKT